METVIFLFCYIGKKVYLFSQFHSSALICIPKILDPFCPRFCWSTNYHYLGSSGSWRTVFPQRNLVAFSFLFQLFPSKVDSRTAYTHSSQKAWNYNFLFFSLPTKFVIGEFCSLIEIFAPFFMLPEKQKDIMYPAIAYCDNQSRIITWASLRICWHNINMDGLV